MYRSNHNGCDDCIYYATGVVCVNCKGTADTRTTEYKNRPDLWDDGSPEHGNDSVNHPSHYCRESGMECFDEFMLIYGREAAIHACLFNIHKYRYRAADKNGEEDLRKSDWYVRKLKELKEGVENG